MTTRADILLESVDRNARIIEIGASYSPIAPKRHGWNTKTLDVGTRAELVEKYQGLDTVDAIEEVDFIWRDGPLISAVPPECHGSFDVFVACGVIEHQPDVIAFLECAEKLLKSTGIVALAISDKRFCFDYFLPCTLAGDVIASHRLGRTRHSPQTTFNFGAYSVAANYTLTWSQHSIEGASFAFLTTLEDAYQQFVNCDESRSSAYVDMHAWQFTTASFQLLMLELARLGLTDWRVERIAPSVGFEFHAWLCRGGREAAASASESQLDLYRLALLKRTLIEVKEQFDFLMPATDGAKAENEMLRAERSALQATLAEKTRFIMLQTASEIRPRQQRRSGLRRSSRLRTAIIHCFARHQDESHGRTRLSGVFSVTMASRRPFWAIAHERRGNGSLLFATTGMRSVSNRMTPGFGPSWGTRLGKPVKSLRRKSPTEKALEFDVDDSDTRAALAGALAMQGKSIEPID